MRILDGKNIRDLDLGIFDKGRLDDLPKEYSAYFVQGDYDIISLEHLVLTRARVDGVPSAERKMRAAVEGRIEKREPISVRQEGHDYLVCDGNSTVIILELLGVKHVPVVYAGN